MLTRNIIKYIVSAISIVLFVALFVWLLFTIVLPVVLPTLIGTVPLHNLPVQSNSDDRDGRSTPQLNQTTPNPDNGLVQKDVESSIQSSVTPTGQISTEQSDINSTDGDQQTQLNSGTDSPNQFNRGSSEDFAPAYKI